MLICLLLNIDLITSVNYRADESMFLCLKFFYHTCSSYF
jgi:hypothetical protein